MKRKRTTTSYENLLSHIRTAHPDYETLMVSDKQLTQSQVDRFFTSAKSSSYYGWYDLVINCLLPFSTVENLTMRENVRHDSISLSTFTRHLPALSQLVEKKVAELLPNKFALVFDGWTNRMTHFLGVFASFPDSNQEGYSVRLLAFSPFEDEASLGRDEHIRFLDFVLNLFNKSWDNVVCIIADNCNLNKSIATAKELPFLGCASHRFNLAMTDILRNHEELLDRVNNLMCKLRTPIMAARLMKLTVKRAKTRNYTRWSSAFEMLKRYQELREFLPNMDESEIDDIALTNAENRNLDKLMPSLKDLESVTKRLQERNVTVSDVRGLFDSVMDEYPDTTPRLSTSASILYSPVFESAVVKVQLGKAAALSRDERSALEEFRTPELIPSESSAGATLSLAERALKRQRRESVDGYKNFINLRFLLPTSNICERLFSVAGNALHSRRAGLSPVSFEGQLFLHLNNDLWGPKEVGSILKRSE